MPTSGLIQTDQTSWKNNIYELINKNKPDAIVMVIGANDNHQSKRFTAYSVRFSPNG